MTKLPISRKLIHSSIIIILIFLVNSISSYDCPELCDCRTKSSQTSLTNSDEIQFIAKCSSINGLKSVIAGKKSSITSIDLSDLKLNYFSLNLENFKNLTELNLSNNKLTELNKLNKKVLKLNLSNNLLTSTKLTKLPEFVRYLDLSHNQLTHIPKDLMRLTRLRSLELTGNPINCDCQTIEVRNWLQQNHVWSDRHVKCFTPIQYRNMSWLQVKQSDVCDRSKKSIPLNNGYLWATTHDDDDDDDMMLADSPIWSGETNDNSADDELNKEYIKLKKDKRETTIGDVDGGELSGGESGDESGSTTLLESSGTKQIVDEENEGSGSGDFPAILPSVPFPGIFQEELPKKVNITPISMDPPEIDSSEKTKKLAEIVATEEETAKAGTDDDSGVYILLAIIFLIFIVLLVFVIYKRKQRKERLKKRGDIETGGKGTELKTMDRNNIGKRAESAPLITEKPENINDDIDKPTMTTFSPLKEDKEVCKPLLESNKSNDEKPNGNLKDKSSSNENLPNGNGKLPNGHTEKPETNSPIVPVHHSRFPHYEPINHDYERPKSEHGDPITSLPNSPILERANARYSPVYSPETGRVKIKSGTMPRPKTPLIVNRTKSNAGDIVLTPTSPTPQSNE